MSRIRRRAGFALFAAALTVASEAHAYEIVIEEAEFRLTVEGDREPGCVVFPESATVEKDCAGLDVATLRALQPAPGAMPVGLFALAVEGGVVLARVEWKPHTQKTKFPTRENLVTIAQGAASGSIPAGSAQPVTSVVRIADVDMVEARLTMPDATGARRVQVRSYTVPAPSGMVQIAFAATDERAVAAMEAFADKSMATLRVAAPPAATEEPEQTSRESTRTERLLSVALICGLLAAGVVYVVRRRR